jgi:hypothetical protein
MRCPERYNKSYHIESETSSDKLQIQYEKGFKCITLQVFCLVGTLAILLHMSRPKIPEVLQKSFEIAQQPLRYSRLY